MQVLGLNLYFEEMKGNIKERMKWKNKMVSVRGPAKMPASAKLFCSLAGRRILTWKPYIKFYVIRFVVMWHNCLPKMSCISLYCNIFRKSTKICCRSHPAFQRIRQIDKSGSNCISKAISVRKKEKEKNVSLPEFLGIMVSCWVFYYVWKQSDINYFYTLALRLDCLWLIPGVTSYCVTLDKWVDFSGPQFWTP